MNGMNEDIGKTFFPIQLDAVVLECEDVVDLSNFYIRLLGWKKNFEAPGAWIDIVPPSGGVKIAFQQNKHYVPPVWPDSPGAQQQMAHLDFIVMSAQQMKLAEQHAVACGAVKTAVQFGDDKWVTLFDPAGHPFCFVLWP